MLTKTVLGHKKDIQKLSKCFINLQSITNKKNYIYLISIRIDDIQHKQHQVMLGICASPNWRNKNGGAN